MLIATTSNLDEPSSFCRRSSAGISLRQGAHQVAHRLTSTTLPRQSESVFSVPLASWKRTSDRASGSFLNTKAAMWPWLRALLPGPDGSAVCLSDEMVDGVSAAGRTALSDRPNVTYTAANPATAAIAAAHRAATGARVGEPCFGLSSIVTGSRFLQ